MKLSAGVPINIKFMLPIILITILMISLYALFMRLSTEKLFKQYAIDEVNLTLGNIDKIITIHSKTGNPDDFKAYLSSLYNTDIKNIVTIGMLSPTGKPLFIYPKTNDMPINIPIGQKYLVTTINQHHDIVELYYNAYNHASCFKCHKTDGSLLGIFYVKVSTASSNIAFEGLLSNWFIVSIIITSILVFSIWLITETVINRPIDELVNTLKMASEGDLSVRTKIDDNDELGFLSKQLNMMLDRLAYNDAEIKKTTELHIRRMDKLASLGEISLSLAHEIRNPLAGISGVLQVFKEDFATNEEKTDIFNQIMAQISRIDKIIGDMLKFSRASIYEGEELNLNDTIKAMQILLEPQASNNHVKIRLSFAQNIPSIIEDRDGLQQVFINLLLNAIQAMPEGGTLTASTNFIDKYGEPYILATISDTGKGIPDDAKDKIFDPFFTTKQHGTGLGLAISLKIIRSMNGDITFESEKGKGTTFYIRIPYKKA
ncbi:MAG: ATP-binding protein [Deltaproteobacteria bacterium]|nr:ATP-binding protein [Deltaproteobacteria bacterium]